MEEILDAQRPGCPVEYFNIDIPKGHAKFDPEDKGGRYIPFPRSRYDQTTGYSPNNPRQQVRSPDSLSLHCQNAFSDLLVRQGVQSHQEAEVFCGHASQKSLPHGEVHT